MLYSKTKLIIFLLALTIIGLGWFFIFSPKIIVLESNKTTNLDVINSETSIEKKDIVQTKTNTDIENQKPLSNPPEIINAVYMTSWSMSTESRINYLINLKKTTQINAAVIDIKDYTGLIAYDIDLPQIDQYQTKEIRMRNINSLIKRLHDEGIYLIARIAVFEDSALAKARPDLAVQKNIQKASSTPEYVTWKDNKNLAWVDPTSKEVWDYNISIAKDAISRGFDEINFDYIRFPSDGNMSNIYFPFWDEKISKSDALKNFFKYLRESLPGVKTSADIFGLVTIKKDDMGIGQIIEDIYPYFDYIAPMVYPSHYAPGTLGYKNPANYPYEIVKYSIDGALNRLIVLENNAASSTVLTADGSLPMENRKINAKIRPWLQDFNIGATYTANMIKFQIRATADSLGDRYNGFMMWNPSNVYVKEALQ